MSYPWPSIVSKCLFSQHKDIQMVNNLYYTLPSHLVVIHDCVEWFNPHWIDVSVQNNPLGSTVADIGQFAHDAGEEAC